MTTLLSIDRFLPPYRYTQDVVTEWVRSWLEENDNDNATRLLSVYASAGVKTRASVIPIEEVFRPGDFETQNDRYRAIVRDTGIELARRALASAGLEPREITLVVTLSCTGFMIPAVHASLARAPGMGPRPGRPPITPGGCA